MATARERIQRIRDFLDEAHVISQDQANLPWLRRTMHFWWLVGRSFVRNRAPVRASALAYTTLLALIPILAVFVSISTSFQVGREQSIEFIENAIRTMAPQLGLDPQGTTEEKALES